MLIGFSVLDDLTAQAKKSPRLRAALDLRTSSSDTSQRILNAVEPGTHVPIHRHLATSETLIVIRGAMTEFFYDDSGSVINSFRLSALPGQSTLSIPAGQWHTIADVESSTIILEGKDGAYQPFDKNDVLDISTK